MKDLKIKANYPEHGKVVLINEKGNTFTSKSEELIDFLISSESPEPSPTVVGKDWTNLVGYSLNDAIGSTHWFNTLMANVLHIGEYMRDKSEEKLYKEWGNQLYRIARDMFEWHASLAAASPEGGDGVELNSERTQDNLRAIRNYFRENDKTPFQQWAHMIIDSLIIKK